jgi:chromosome segregation ATPase
LSKTYAGDKLGMYESETMAIGVKEADVWAAADALLHAGEQPTIERVRLHLGRGSPNTVGPHLKNWFRGLSERLLAGQGGASDIPQAVAQAVSQVWETALAAARAEREASSALERAEITKQKEALEAARVAVAQAQERLHARETDLEASVEAAHAQAFSAETRLQSAERQLTESAEALKSMSAELVASRDQVIALQRVSQEAQAAHQEAFAAAEARHGAHERRWLEELDEQRQALKKSREELSLQHKTAIRRQAELTEALTSTRKEAQSLAGTLADIQAERARLVSQMGGERETALAVQNGLERRNADLQSHLDEMREQIMIKDAQITALTRQLTVRRAVRRKSPDDQDIH